MTLKKLVFVVDNDPEILETVSLILKDYCTLYLFPAVDAQFKELLRKLPPDILFIDFITPLTNITETIEAMRKQYGEKTKIYLMYSTKFNDIPPLNVDGYLKKPFLVQDIRDLVNDTINLK